MEFEFINKKLPGRTFMVNDKKIPFSILRLEGEKEGELCIFTCAVDEKENKIYVDGEVI